MKTIHSIVPGLALLSILSAAQCNKDKEPLEQLPPETQTGARTFGCLVNGKVFKPKGSGLTNILTCFYQYIYNSPSGYVFALKATNSNGNAELTSISIGADSIKLENGRTYILQAFNPGNASGSYTYSPGSTAPLETSITNNVDKGELQITKFDEMDQIISGRFWFTVVNKKGDTVRITDGRFDMKYTR